jgi:ABC-2 type transport system ATP-binding protein
VIEAAGLVKRFGGRGGRTAVDGVSLRVEPGEVVGFLGPNGAGKTTTLRMLLGLLAPSSGSARVAGAVGYLPEVFAAYPELSVKSYLRFCCRMKRVDGAGAEIDRVLGLAGIADLGGRLVGRLSKGQRQRLGIAQALLGRPGAYVLDEPTAGLDPKQVVEARALFRSLASDDGAAVLVSTHVLSEAAAMCDRVVVLANGRVVAEERPGQAGDLEARFLRVIGEAELS